MFFVSKSYLLSDKIFWHLLPEDKIIIFKLGRHGRTIHPHHPITPSPHQKKSSSNQKFTQFFLEVENNCLQFCVTRGFSDPSQTMVSQPTVSSQLWVLPPSQRSQEKPLLVRFFCDPSQPTLFLTCTPASWEKKHAKRLVFPLSPTSRIRYSAFFFGGGGGFVGRNSLKVSKKKNVCQLPIFVEGPNLIYFHRWEGPNCSWTRTQESCQYSHFWWPAYGWTLKKWCLSKFGISNLLCLGVYFQVHSVWFLWMYKIYKYTNARQLQYHSFCPTGFDIDSKQSEYCTQPFLFALQDPKISRDTQPQK